MWQRTRRSLSRISPKTRLAALTLLAAVVVGVGVAWTIANTTGRATSDPGSPVARFEPPDTSPLPEALATLAARTPIPYPPPPSEGCEDATRTESPGPGLPLLPKHNCIQEPKPGTIASPLTGERVDPKDVPEGWRVINNEMFRFTLAVPPDWYVNMLPDGGAFEIISPTALALLAKPDRGEAERAGVEIAFIAYKYRPGGQDPTSKGLANPNASFNGTPGAIWEESPTGDPTVLRMIRAAFVRYDYVFSGNAWFGQGYTDSDADTTQKIFASITPY
jgi:hypothetical protein